MRFQLRNERQEKENLMVESINALFGTADFANTEFSAAMYSTEANKKFTFEQQSDMAAPIRTSLVQAGLEEFLKQHCSFDAITDATERKLTQERIDRAMESAVMTAIALGDAESYHRAYCNAKPQENDGFKVLIPSMRSQASSLTYSTEGYDAFEFKNFRATSIVTNALNAMTNSFEDVWFKPVMISPSEQGADVSIRIPYVFNTKLRSTQGAEYKPDNRLVIDAYRDRSILANTGNEVYANVDKIDAALIAAAADVPNIKKVLNSVQVNTRPLKFNNTIDILGASAHPGLAASDMQSQEDTLARAMRLGDVYVKFDDGTNSVVSVINTSALNGSLFVPAQIGDEWDLVLNMKSPAQVKHDGPTADSTPLTSVTGLSGAIGNPAVTDPFQVTLTLSLSGRAHPLHGNIEVNTAGANPVQIVAIHDKDGAKVSDAVLATVKANVTVSLIGYVPKLYRTNSNLRDKGQMCDMGTAIKYRIAVPILSPITSSQPLSVEGGAMGMDGLQMINRATRNGLAVQTLFDYESVIEACDGQKTPHAGIGSHLVTPTYVKDVINLEEKTVIMRSAGARDDLREAIGAALDQIASEMLERSGYLATLDAMYGTTSGFEFIVVTSPRIHSLLMTSGDARLLGANRKFTIVSNHEDDFIDKIYISVRRPGESNVDPLSFAAHVSMPPLVYNAPVHVENGSHSKLVQLLPRDIFVGTCPILGRLDLIGINNLFTGTSSTHQGTFA